MANSVNPCISIIVPAYNVEKYVDICLDSILASSYKDFEILCVDDKSTDLTPKILDNYANLDSRIRVYHRPRNVGLSQSRNFAVKKAKGRYTMFVDADDWISPLMLQRMVQGIENHDSDMIMCEVMRVDHKTNQQMVWSLLDRKTFLETVKLPAYSEEKMPAWLAFKLHTMAWAKLYKSEFIKDFKFPKGLIYEDNPYFMECYLKAKKISFDFAPLYYYRINRPDSIISAGNRKTMDIFKILDMSEKIICDAGKYEKYKDYFLLNKLEMILYRMLTAPDDIQEEMYNMLKQDIHKIKFDEFDLTILRRNPVYDEALYIVTMDYKQYMERRK